jgi:hypothetical protein
MIECACGCGETFRPSIYSGKDGQVCARFKRGHATHKSWNKGKTKQDTPKLAIAAQKTSTTRKRLIAEGKLKVIQRPRTLEERKHLSEVRKRLFAEGKLPTPIGCPGRKSTPEELKRKSESMKKAWQTTRQHHDRTVEETCARLNCQGFKTIPLSGQRYQPDGIIVDFENRKILALEVERQPTPKRMRGWNPRKDFDDIFIVDISIPKWRQSSNEFSL